MKKLITLFALIAVTAFLVWFAPGWWWIFNLLWQRSPEFALLFWTAPFLVAWAYAARLTWRVWRRGKGWFKLPVPMLGHLSIT